MNKANQDALVQRMNVDLVNIRLAEINYFSVFFAQFGTQAAILGGAVIGSLAQTRGFDHQGFYFFHLLYYIPSAMCLAGVIHMLLGSAFVTIGMWYIVMDNVGATAGSIVIVVFGMITYRSALRIYNRFKYEEHDIAWDVDRDEGGAHGEGGGERDDWGEIPEPGREHINRKGGGGGGGGGARERIRQPTPVNNYSPIKALWNVVGDALSGAVSIVAATSSNVPGANTIRGGEQEVIRSENESTEIEAGSGGIELSNLKFSKTEEESAVRASFESAVSAQTSTSSTTAATSSSSSSSSSSKTSKTSGFRNKDAHVAFTASTTSARTPSISSAAAAAATVMDLDTAGGGSKSMPGTSGERGGILGGYLSLQSAGGWLTRAVWERRFFVIKRAYVFYYKDKRSYLQNPARPINQRPIELEGYTLVAGSRKPPFTLVGLRRGRNCWGVTLTVKTTRRFVGDPWERRFFVIKGISVFYCKDKRSYQQAPADPLNKRAIELDGYTLVAGAKEPPYNITLAPVDPEDIRKSWKFRCDTIAEFNSWIEIFSAALHSSNIRTAAAARAIVAQQQQQVRAKASNTGSVGRGGRASVDSSSGGTNSGKDFVVISGGRT